MHGQASLLFPSQNAKLKKNNNSKTSFYFVEYRINLSRPNLSGGTDLSELNDQTYPRHGTKVTKVTKCMKFTI